MFSIVIVPLFSLLSPKAPSSSVSVDMFIVGEFAFCVSERFLNDGKRTDDTVISFSALTLSPGYIPRYNED